MAKTEMLAARTTPKFLELLNKLVLLSQLGQTGKSYKDTSGFIMTAVTRQMQETFFELAQNEMVRPLMRDLLEGFDLADLLEINPARLKEANWANNKK